MPEFVNSIWPRPQKESTEELERSKQFDLELDNKIKNLAVLRDEDLPSYLEAVRRIADEEGKRKLGAETRATTFIAAVATLIPLMTWALGNTEIAICSKGWGCFIWTTAFVLAVVYFVTAARWSLRSLAVANFHVIGVEDIVAICEQEKHIVRELIQQTLRQAHKNRDTINEKLTCIKIAQRRFFNGLFILGCLLMLDPVSRFGTLSFIQSKIDAWGTSSAFGGLSCMASNQLIPLKSNRPQNTRLAMPRND